MDASLGVHSSTGWRMLQQQHGRIERSDGGDTVRRQSKAGAASAAQWEEWCASACVLFVLQHACALSTGPLAAFLKYNFFVNGKKSFLLFLSVFCLLSRMRLARHQATVQGCPPAYPFVSILFLFFFFAWPILLWSRLGSVSLSLSLQPLFRISAEPPQQRAGEEEESSATIHWIFVIRMLAKKKHRQPTINLFVILANKMRNDYDCNEMQMRQDWNAQSATGKKHDMDKRVLGSSSAAHIHAVVDGRCAIDEWWMKLTDALVKHWVVPS